jgi:hypothetical protein
MQLQTREAYVERSVVKDRNDSNRDQIKLCFRDLQAQPMSYAPAIQSQAHVTAPHFRRGVDRAPALRASQTAEAEVNTNIRLTQAPLEHTDIDIPIHFFLYTHFYRPAQWQYESPSKHAARQTLTVGQASPLPTSELEQIASNVCILQLGRYPELTEPKGL